MNPYVAIGEGLWALMFAYWFAKRILGTKPTIRSTPLKEALRFRVPWVLGFALVFVPFSPGFLGMQILPSLGWLKASGVGLCFLGLAFSVWARNTLGTNWSSAVTVKADHQLIQNGPYSLSRHPIYSGFLLAFVGMVLCIGELRALAGLASLWFSYEVKVRVEERFMAEQFGEAYAQYAARVSKLVPFVY